MKTIIFLFYDGMTALDAIGPHIVLAHLPEVQVKHVARKAGAIQTDAMQLTLIAEHSIEDVSRADVLVVPGGGNATTLEQYPEVLEWIRAIHQTTTWTTSVCTGSLILGAAGLLQGLSATSHWAVMDRLKKWGAIPMQQRVVEAGKIITAAGVSAGIDMGLTLAAKIAGETVAKRIQLGIEYDPHPPFDCGSVAKAAPAMVQALRAAFECRFEKEK
ncbi:MAG: DJ-1/PfpI family protein [Chthoniobacterales bacterium]|nr:DJ-1/PfpI family protein [Chthoniobacterales bacterium]